MSATTGQRARFHLNRKRRVVQRMRVEALKQEIASKGEPATTPTATAAAPAARRKGPARRATA